MYTDFVRFLCCTLLGWNYSQAFKFLHAVSTLPMKTSRASCVLNSSQYRISTFYSLYTEVRIKQKYENLTLLFFKHAETRRRQLCLNLFSPSASVDALRSISYLTRCNHSFISCPSSSAVESLQCFVSLTAAERDTCLIVQLERCK